MPKPDRYDYIIVGAGSAGCTLANKLGADTSKSILVIEAGPMDRDLLIHIPAGVYRAWRDPKLNWNYLTEPESNLLDRQVDMPRGKVVGGSSSINSMVYMRGHPLDYDAWADHFGLTDWRYENCLPYFRAGETYAKGSNSYRGDSGPLGVHPGDFDNPLYDAFLEAGEQAGQGRSDDLNGFNPEGVARLDATKRHGRRCSAAVAHLRPALKRGNVTLMTRTMVKRLTFDGTRATGLICDFGSKELRLEAEQEVILSGGAINSPQLLMLSGIGPADHLNRHGITPLLNLPVGQNLQDHASIILQFESLHSYPIHRVDRIWNKARVGAQWVFTRRGIAASNIWEAGGLIRGNDTVPYPNLQYHFGPVGFEYVGDKIQLRQAFAIHVDQLRPRSRGEIRLASANPTDKPLMHFNYLQDPFDLQELVEGVQKTRELVAQPAFDGLRGAEIDPGPEVQTAKDVENWIRNATVTDFHPCGTCRMGHGDDCVVDDHFRVKGLQGLRVVDASVMPRVISANLNAPTQMIAARAADYIAGQPQLDPIKAPFAFQN
ncbi:Oxygen-dependent choline dehydrogenase [Roseovarius albus]|uniref:Oxygen-dependent choline dehydrogenase n=1 Tax=Roseovarius albus TaxID=1247867 RepID=A0A1X6ZNW8_9RHOB|nr:choline dehydrogenase [Roseovarius albus]SLN56812.1 Oxygen-dependent choline dehydrogenase [Roseovarius albus]